MLGLECLVLAAILATSSHLSRQLRAPLRIPRPTWAWALLLSAPLWLAVQVWLPVHLGWLPNKLAPDATWSTALLGLPLVVCLVAGRWVAGGHVLVLAKAWLWVALVQALWGLLQVAGLDGLRFEALSGEPAIGSFASKNTYSNLLVMAVPLAVWRLGVVRNEGERRGRGDGGFERLPRAWGWVVALLLLLCTLLLSTSRTGIASGLLMLLLALPLLLLQRVGTQGKASSGWWWVLAGMTALICLTLLVAGWDWAARFEASRLVADDFTRSLMRQTTWQAAMAHWPWGSGLGTYADVYPAWQPAELGHRMIDLAHNDYLQLLVELGLASVVLAAAVLWLIVQRLWQMWRSPAPTGGQDRSMYQLQVAAGLGVLAIALHAWVDYPFHIPANAMMGCFLLGVFLRPHGVGAHTNAQFEVKK